MLNLVALSSLPLTAPFGAISLPLAMSLSYLMMMMNLFLTFPLTGLLTLNFALVSAIITPLASTLPLLSRSLLLWCCLRLLGGHSNHLSHLRSSNLDPTNLRLPFQREPTQILLQRETTVLWKSFLWMIPSQALPTPRKTTTRMIPMRTMNPMTCSILWILTTMGGANGVKNLTVTSLTNVCGRPTHGFNEALATRNKSPTRTVEQPVPPISQMEHCH